ncbi:Abi family protein [Rhodococcus jostii]|uniref:Abi family protein n=1 Tax=Rhodococcus jostii TaxID=132919 RepID=UPI00366044EA
MSTPVKPFLSIADQIARIKSRGMQIDDEAKAARWLEAVGYYRLSGYWYPFRLRDPSDPERRSDMFAAGSTFREVTQLYEFDRHLKSLIHSGLERVEVAMRSQIGYTLGQHDPLAYKDSQLFRSTFAHNAWNATAGNRIARGRGRDQFIDHHDAKYGSLLPIWVLTDVLDFADISKLFDGMISADQRAVADWFDLAPRPDASKNQRKKWGRRHPLANWLLHLTIVRNICAHHGRLWNRQLTPVSTPATAHLPGFDGLPADQTERVYGTICIIAFLLRSTSPGNTWTSKIESLVEGTFSGFNHRSVAEMGFPSNWKALPLWAK